jgi:Protein of unknown function (DUF2950)
MRQAKLNLDKFHWTNLPRFAAIAILWVACVPVHSVAQQPGQKTFSSPEDASNALLKAAKNNDEKTMLEIFGPDGKRIVSSGDEAEDAQSRARFVKKYEEMHRLFKEPNGTTVVLYIGAENWPTPIPIVRKGHSWYFETSAGEREILFRRIGRNELSAIRICQELVAAEKEHSSAHHNEYAQKILSDDGQHDGLYWKATGSETRSPIGPLVAAAFTPDRTESADIAPAPYRGYHFHILTAQGKNAPGGAKSYIVDGKMTKGFAFVAYPAEYRSSGVMTFIVSDKGGVYEQDLGKRSGELAKAMKEYNPGPAWKKAELPQQEVANKQ